MIEIPISSSITLYHKGPPLNLGPLPSIFYFALSGPDSLTKDPFNQPVQFLENHPIRTFSLTLPAHENDLSPHEALASWAKDLSTGKDVLTPFFGDILKAVNYTIDHSLADPKKLGLAGLSRGGLITSHIAALDPRFKAILQFAPVTRLSKTKDFLKITDQSFDTFHLIPKLADRHIRFHIGNKDTQVDTRSCLDFALALADASTLRSPQIELLLTPSIGRNGHGTSPESFRSGAEWLATQIL